MFDVTKAFPTGDSAGLQIFDLLQLSRREHISRAESRKAVRRLRKWQSRAGSAPSSGSSIHDRIFETILRRQAEDATLCYRIIRRDRIALFKAYIADLPKRTAVFASA